MWCAKALNDTRRMRLVRRFAPPELSVVAQSDCPLPPDPVHRILRQAVLVCCELGTRAEATLDGSL
ncbi:hypothetical protein MCOR29_000652 [Pyricularia oryzae]|nr:hypothetical protein MCOR29_000652 [Pyricularia oryzae]KAI6372628.1 hypothetical protein MCOR31_003619 [Pyricularia oryzae]KAI6407814.1 hypothetical protein MCOR23_001649 [Pyricularia oryzae]KAI6444565.1 hypothetical protein MCOR22_004782 [Pyricularia oryzae]